VREKQAVLALVYEQQQVPMPQQVPHFLKHMIHVIKEQLEERQAIVLHALGRLALVHHTTRVQCQRATAGSRLSAALVASADVPVGVCDAGAQRAMTGGSAGPADAHIARLGLTRSASIVPTPPTRSASVAPTSLSRSVPVRTSTPGISSYRSATPAVPSFRSSPGISIASQVSDYVNIASATFRFHGPVAGGVHCCD
jgi:nucleoid DNA-binding protein